MVSSELQRNVRLRKFCCQFGLKLCTLLVESKSSALILDKMQPPERLKEQAEGTVETHIGEHTASDWAIRHQCRFELSSS